MVQIVAKPNTDTKLQAYFLERLAHVSDRILESTEALFSEESAKRDKAFEEEIDRRLKNGARFVRRKRQSS